MWGTVVLRVHSRFGVVFADVDLCCLYRYLHAMQVCIIRVINDCISSFFLLLP